MKKLLFVAVSAVITGVLLALIFTGVKKAVDTNDSELNTSDTVNYNTDNSRGCYVTKLFAYTGTYNENGEGVYGESIAAIRVGNTSDVDYRYIEITVKTDAGEYSFLATSLLAGENMTVIEKNGAVLSADEDFVSAEIVSFDIFDETPSMQADRFAVTLEGDKLTVKNISDEDIDGEVYVYIKNTDDDGYFGGITYRISAGTLKRNGEITVPVETGTDKGAVPLFVTVE